MCCVVFAWTAKTKATLMHRRGNLFTRQLWCAVTSCTNLLHPEKQVALICLPLSSILSDTGASLAHINLKHINACHLALSPRVTLSHSQWCLRVSSPFVKHLTKMLSLLSPISRSGYLETLLIFWMVETLSLFARLQRLLHACPRILAYLDYKTFNVGHVHKKLMWNFFTMLKLHEDYVRRI